MTQWFCQQNNLYLAVLIDFFFLLIRKWSQIIMETYWRLVRFFWKGKATSLDKRSEYWCGLPLCVRVKISLLYWFKTELFEMLCSSFWWNSWCVVVDPAERDTSVGYRSPRVPMWLPAKHQILMIRFLICEICQEYCENEMRQIESTVKFKC